eukprot:s629_g20.t1
MEVVSQGKEAEAKEPYRPWTFESCKDSPCKKPSDDTRELTLFVEGGPEGAGSCDTRNTGQRGKDSSDVRTKAPSASAPAAPPRTSTSKQKASGLLALGSSEGFLAPKRIGTLEDNLGTAHDAILAARPYGQRSSKDLAEVLWELLGRTDGALLL